MSQYIVTGMSCAACVARVEKAVLAVPGVEACTVSLLTNSMSVTGTAEAQIIMSAVKEAGYEARPKGGSVQLGNTVGGGIDNGNGNIGQPADFSSTEEALRDHETPKLKQRLSLSLALLLVLMYFSMGTTMLGLPLPAFFVGNYVALGLVQLLLALAVMVVNQAFFISGFKSAWHMAPNMDTLVAMGSAVSFLYSTWALFAMTAAQVQGGAAAAQVYLHEFYFETAAMILTLITVGKLLEARSKGRTTAALKSLLELAPKEATLVKDGVEVKVPIEQVLCGDEFVVRAGESIPVDGVIVDGACAVNEAALTGESLPVDKAVGDAVASATINQAGFIRCCATRVGQDTTLAQIIQLVSDAAATKAPVAKIADKVAAIFVPVVLVLALLTFFVWLVLGASVGEALAYGIAVLVISCPCSLGLATPVAIMVGNGVGAKHGILYKTAAAIEAAGKVKIVALDKTGTLTAGEPVVTDVLPLTVKEAELAALAYALERKSEHPLGKAVVRWAEQLKCASTGDASCLCDFTDVTDFQTFPGNGLAGRWGESQLLAGSVQFVSGKIAITEAQVQQAAALAEAGKTPLCFVRDGQLLGIIAVADSLKEDAVEAVAELKELGLQVVMLTGDNERTARAIAVQAGVDEVIAGVLPAGKEAAIRQLKEKGPVAMVGDGINDAPALTQADVGLAIGAGADVAVEAADIVLMKSGLLEVPAAIRLSRATLRNIHQNLFWAFFYNALGIPLAAGVFAGLLGWRLSPMFGAAAMSLSSFCVVSNALRLNWTKLYKDVVLTDKDEAGKDVDDDLQDQQEATDDEVNNELKAKTETQENINAAQANEQNNVSKENNSMETKKTMHIEGMMCGHCEARVKKILEAIPGVKEAVVSHEAGTAVVTLTEAVDDVVLKEKVEAQDYPVKGIE